MALYRLVSVKFSRRVHKKDEDGNLMYRDEDKKSPVYEMKSYDIGQTVDLSAFEAKRLKNNLPVIIITGYSTESSAIEAVNLGVTGYLTKPFRVPQVLAAAAKALGE